MTASTGGLWLSVLVAVSSLAAAARQETQPERGEQILHASCTGCHDLRPIQVQALDHETWTERVNAEIGKGAKLEPKDIPILVDYLVKHHGPLPDGDGKHILLNTCTLCHDLQRVRQERATPEGWAEILDAMLNEGAPLSEQEFPVLLRYLARNFGPAR